MLSHTGGRKKNCVQPNCSCNEIQTKSCMASQTLQDVLLLFACQEKLTFTDCNKVFRPSKKQNLICLDIGDTPDNILYAEPAIPAEFASLNIEEVKK